MKKKSILLLALCLLLSAFALTGCGKSEPAAMIVNGVEVPQGVINYYLYYGKDYMASFGIDVNDDEYGPQYMSLLEEQAVDIATEIAVTKSLAKEAGLTIDKATLDDAMAEEKSYFFDDTEWEDWLFAYQLTEADVRWILEYQLLADALYEKVNSDLTLSDAELAEIYNADPAAYDTYRFAHILIAVNATTDEAGNTIEPDAAAWEQARATAVELIAQLNDGSAKFEDLASQYNTDSTADRGGDLGEYVTAKESPYMQEFNDAAFQLTTVGEFTQEPVRTAYGYHIIKLLDRTVGVGEAKNAIINQQLGTQRDERYFSQLEEAIQNAEITQDYARKFAIAADDAEDTGDTGATNSAN